MPSDYKYKYRPIPAEKRRQPCPACGVTITRFAELQFHRDPVWLELVAKALDYDVAFLSQLNPRTRIHENHFRKEDIGARGKPIGPPTIAISRIAPWPPYKSGVKPVILEENSDSDDEEKKPRREIYLKYRRYANRPPSDTFSDASEDSPPPTRRKSRRIEELAQKAPTPKPEPKKPNPKKTKQKDEKKPKETKPEPTTPAKAKADERAPPVLSMEKPVETPVLLSSPIQMPATLNPISRNSMSFVVTNSTSRMPQPAPRIEFGTGPPGATGPTATVNGQPAQVFRNPDGSISLILPPMNPTTTAAVPAPVYNSMGTQIAAGRTPAYHPSLPPPTTIIRAPAGVPLSANAIVSTARAAAVASTTNVSMSAAMEDTETNTTSTELLQRLIETAMENNSEKEKSSQPEVEESPQTIRVKTEPVEPEIIEEPEPSPVQPEEDIRSTLANLVKERRRVRPLLGPLISSRQSPYNSRERPLSVRILSRSTTPAPSSCPVPAPGSLTQIIRDAYLNGDGKKRPSISPPLRGLSSAQLEMEVRKLRTELAETKFQLQQNQRMQDQINRLNSEVVSMREESRRERANLTEEMVALRQQLTTFSTEVKRALQIPPYQRMQFHW